jgi:hypothetical protein
VTILTFFHFHSNFIHRRRVGKLIRFRSCAAVGGLRFSAMSSTGVRRHPHTVALLLLELLREPWRLGLLRLLPPVRGVGGHDSTVGGL